MREAVEEIIHAISRTMHRERVRTPRRVPRSRQPHHARSTFVPAVGARG